MTDPRQMHWDSVYASQPATKVSWYESRPQRSLDFIRATGIASLDPIIDVGGGASVLVDALIEADYHDLTVLDVSAEALRALRERLGSRAERVTFLLREVTEFEPSRQYALWHDRAVFHFLVEPSDRRHYVQALHRALRRGGHAIVCTFGPEGPQRCSGLPVVRYDAAALAAELGPEFSLVDSVLTIHRTPRGVEQQFLNCRFIRATPEA